MTYPLISIIILTHNAPTYVETTINSLNEITEKDTFSKCEVIVWDNGSQEETIKVIKELHAKGYISKYKLSEENLLFAGGNNQCVKLASPSSEYYLLLNSDIKIINPDWLKNLLKAKTDGGYSIASYGVAHNPNRSDGFCYLIDRKLYDKYPLEERFQWFWGITKQQSDILALGGGILGFTDYEDVIIHYGGKSGQDFINAKGMDLDQLEIFNWFNGKNRVDFKISPGIRWYRYLNIWMRKLLHQFKRIIKNVNYR